MPENPEPDSGEPEETWDQMAARVAAEEVSASYARTLWASMAAYRGAGFTDAQAWDLTLAEHTSRLDYLGRSVMMSMFVDADDEDPPEG